MANAEHESNKEYNKFIKNDDGTWSVKTVITTSDVQMGGVMINGGDGAKNDTTITLTSATTAYQIPATPIATPHLLILYNSSDTDMFIRFTTGTTNGWGLGTGQSMTIDMGASEKLFAYCASAGKILKYSTRANY